MCENIQPTFINNVVNVRTRKNHNKYTRPPTLEPNTTYILAGIQSNNLISHF